MSQRCWMGVQIWGASIYSWIPRGGIRRDTSKLERRSWISLIARRIRCFGCIMRRWIGCGRFGRGKTWGGGLGRSGGRGQRGIVSTPSCLRVLLWVLMLTDACSPPSPNVTLDMDVNFEVLSHPRRSGRWFRLLITVCATSTCRGSRRQRVEGEQDLGDEQQAWCMTEPEQ